MDMDDKFSSHNSGLESPATDAFLIAPNDASDLAVKPRVLYIGGEGDVRVLMRGVDITFENASGILPIRPDRVFVTNTTATNIIGLY